MNVVRKPVWDESFVKISSSSSHHSASHNEEIALRELLLTLWQGKWLIVACVLFAGAVTLFYAQTRAPHWSSYAQISAPHASDIMGYRQHVQAYQPIFSYRFGDSSPELSALTQPNQLYRQFIETFNSADNKARFRASLGEQAPWIGQITATADEQDRKEYQSLIKQGADVSQIALPNYQLRLQASSAQQSQHLLTQYVEYSVNRTQEAAKANLEALVSAKRNELLQRQKLLEMQAQSRIDAEINRTEAQRLVAQTQNVDTQRYTHHLNQLKNLTNYALVSPELNGIDAKLAALQQLSTAPISRFNGFHNLSDPLAASQQDRASSTLLLLLGCLVGGFIAGVWLLVKSLFKQ
ncbi:Wzz/FepE/Etk N-terminal domain-containing protein [Vibrio olivae]|uniref:Wzz/FepE/Etk N-terminal domain-containing protein n=1 Tax=Vibrio olivae TaxID=1243002 RepID=A0ABV5HQ95_9VIBR